MSNANEIKSMNEWQQAVRVTWPRHPDQRFRIRGELRLTNRQPSTPAPVELLVPKDADDPSLGFFTLRGFAVVRRDPQPVDTQESSFGRLAWLDGRIGFDTRGGLQLEKATLTTSADPGPYENWRRGQRSAIRSKLDRTRHGALVPYLRGIADPKIFWLGHDNTQAFSDAVRDPRVRACITVGHASMSGPTAVPQMCKKLRLLKPESYNLVVLSRGGGDPSEFSIFDDKRLLIALQDCPVPTVCAIGHYADNPLAHEVCTWFRFTPTDLGWQLKSGVTKEVSDRERLEVAVRDGAKALAESHQRNNLLQQAMSRERSRSDWFAHAAHDAGIAQRQLVREESVRRLTQVYERCGTTIATLAPAMAIAGVAFASRSSWLAALMLLAVLTGVVVALLPTRLGKRPLRRKQSSPHEFEAFANARTVGDFNAANAAHPLDEWT